MSNTIQDNNNNQDLHNTSKKQEESSIPKSKDAVRKKISLFSKITFIIACAALIISAYPLLTQKFKINNEPENTDSKQGLILQIQDKQKAFEKQISEQLNGIQENQKQMQKIIDSRELAHGSEKQTNTISEQTWNIIKAKYLLELATLNAQWYDDSDRTITLLKEADALLKNNTNPKINEVGQAISKEIEAIQSQPHVNRMEILTKISEIQDKMSTLSQGQELTAQKTIEDKQSDTEASYFKTHLKNTAYLLSKLIIIRHKDESVNPLISPLQENNILQLIKLQLQEAQWAVINNNQDLFKLALNQAEQNIKNIFNSEDSRIAELIKKLQELEQIPLTQTKIIPDKSLSLIKDFISSQERGNKDPIKKSNKGERE